MQPTSILKVKKMIINSDTRTLSNKVKKIIKTNNRDQIDNLINKLNT
jgi:phosphotransferase system enzyme I (PtsI)